MSGSDLVDPPDHTDRSVHRVDLSSSSLQPTLGARYN